MTSKLSDTVFALRAIKKQTLQRTLKDRDDAKELLKQSEALGKKLDGIEEKLHNPKAKISYDIFAAKRRDVYSQFAWLLANLVEADGATKAQQELADERRSNSTRFVSQFDGVSKDDVSKVNDAAKKPKRAGTLRPAGEEEGGNHRRSSHGLTPMKHG